jgi:pimeloyl-ACP methyl ester carboxylesterase
MERLVLVHGSVAGAAATWAPQRPLAERYELVVVERPGFAPGPPVERVDFEADARLVHELLREGDHLVGHSYGGVIALLAAAGRPDAIRSLTVLEPPATRVALGQADADRFAESGRTWWETGPTGDPEAFLRGFLEAVGSAWDPPTPLPPDLEQGAQMLVVERGPWEAEIPLDALRAAGFPILVVSGAHHAGFEAICDALERELGAERAVLPGVGHTIPRHPDFNRVLADFVDRAAARGGRGVEAETEPEAGAGAGAGAKA